MVIFPAVNTASTLFSIAISRQMEALFGGGTVWLIIQVRSHGIVSYSPSTPILNVFPAASNFGFLLPLSFRGSEQHTTTCQWWISYPRRNFKVWGRVCVISRSFAQLVKTCRATWQWRRLNEASSRTTMGVSWEAFWSPEGSYTLVRLEFPRLRLLLTDWWLFCILICVQFQFPSLIRWWFLPSFECNQSALFYSF